MRILVTGGAGYIGSFMVKRLIDDGYNVTVIDSLERGHKDFLDPRADFKNGSLLDKAFTLQTFKETSFDGIIHFAAYISMGESMLNPGLYFENNVHGTLNLLEYATQFSVQKFIFSSTAGVYGNPVKVPIPEEHQKIPENPYGESKYIVERILSWYQKIHKINFVVLRYFNACGASLDGSHGEDHDPESHIIPNIMKAVLNNTTFTLFGQDYNTPDGTCVRDYIHVLDLIEAHILSLKLLESKTGGFTFNVGTGKGYSNNEVVDMVKRITGTDISLEIGPRRPGDADSLIADPTKLNDELHFKTSYSDLETIVKSAWEWHKRRMKSTRG